jgi:hypothetical protein
VFRKRTVSSDFRQLNSYCTVPKFRNEDIHVRDAVTLVQPDDRFITTDIKDGFYHIRVNPTCRDYSGF